ncbi:hypothetical protein AVM02_13365 [Brucella anthropi]
MLAEMQASLSPKESVTLQIDRNAAKRGARENAPHNGMWKMAREEAAATLFATVFATMAALQRVKSRKRPFRHLATAWAARMRNATACC